jgi:sugar phosphate isomerase/epimerase
MNRRSFMQSSVSLAGAVGLAGLQDVPGSRQAMFTLFDTQRNARLRLGVCAYSYRKYLKRYSSGAGLGTMDMKGFIDKCVELQVDGAELTSYYFPAAPTDEYFYDIRQYAYKKGMPISGTAVGNNFCKPNPADRAEEVRKMKLWIDRAVLFGAPGIRVFGGGHLPEGHSKQEIHKWVVDGLAEAAAYAGSRGVTLAIENHGGYPRDTVDVIQILQDVDSRWLGSNLDTGNFILDPYREIAEVAPYAVNCHFKVEVRTPDGGKVPADVGRIVQIITDAGYKGFVTVEYEAEEEPMTGIPKIVNQIREAIQV